MGLTRIFRAILRTSCGAARVRPRNSRPQHPRLYTQNLCFAQRVSPAPERQRFSTRKFPQAIEIFSRAETVNPKSIAVSGKASHESSALQRIALERIIEKKDKELRFDESEISKHLKRALQAYQKSLQFFPTPRSAVTASAKWRSSISRTCLRRASPAGGHPHCAERSTLPHRARPDLFNPQTLPRSKKECETALTENNFAVQSEAHLVLGWIGTRTAQLSSRRRGIKALLSLDPSQGLCHYYRQKLRRNRRNNTGHRVHENFQRQFVPTALQEIDLLQETDKILQLYRRRKK